jgi:hypothetical protein
LRGLNSSGLFEKDGKFVAKFSCGAADEIGNISLRFSALAFNCGAAIASPDLVNRSGQEVHRLMKYCKLTFGGEDIRAVAAK